jgi:hypothetical protein
LSSAIKTSSYSRVMILSLSARACPTQLAAQLLPRLGVFQDAPGLPAGE